MSSTPADWLTIDAAAARLGCSTRTLQRRIAAGEVRAQRREDGRTLVEVEAAPAGPAPVAAELVERLEKQAEDTNRIAALAALAAEQTSLAFRRQLDTVETALSDARATATSWRRAAAAAACVTVVAAVAVGYLVGEVATTARQASDTQARLDAAEVERKALQAAQAALRGDLAAATALRQASDAEADRLAAEVKRLQGLVGPVSDVSDVVVASDG